MKMAFVSRHEPTQKQYFLAEAQGFELIHIGDYDAFKVSPAFVYEAGPFEAVAVVHPAAALNLAPHFVVGVFRNENRAAVGEKPDFRCTGLNVWNLRE